MSILALGECLIGVLHEAILVVGVQFKHDGIHEDKLALFVDEDMLGAYRLMLVLQVVEEVQSPHNVVNHS